MIAFTPSAQRQTSGCWEQTHGCLGLGVGAGKDRQGEQGTRRDDENELKLGCGEGYGTINLLKNTTCVLKTGGLS